MTGVIDDDGVLVTFLFAFANSMDDMAARDEVEREVDHRRLSMGYRAGADDPYSVLVLGGPKFCTGTPCSLCGTIGSGMSGRGDEYPAVP